MSIFNLNAGRRKEKELNSRQLRAHGEVPAIYYRKNSPSIPLKISQKEIDALLHSPRGIIRLNLDNKENLLVVAKEVQYEPVSHRPLHISFEGIKEGEYFHIGLPVKLEHSENCEWVKAKGTAILKVVHLNIEVLPTKMPDAIHVDTNRMKIGETLFVSDLKSHFPDFKFLDNPHTEVVSIIYAKVVEEEKPAEEKDKDKEKEKEKEGKENTGKERTMPPHT